VSRAHTPIFGFPTLALAGTGTGPDNGTVGVEGHGFVLTRSDASDERLRLRLDVAGQFLLRTPDSADEPRRFAFDLRLAGNATSDDGANYSLAIAGPGHAVARPSHAPIAAFVGYAHVHGIVYDASGEIVANGTFVVKLRAAHNATGQWHWQLVSRSDTPFYGIPRLAMRGTADSADNATLELSGGGAAIVPTDEGPVRLKIRDAHGTLARG
jgi:hypothetical protein